MRAAEINAALEEADAVLVLVAEARGSAPREAGAAMLITPTAALGTIGGGAAEAAAIADARQMFAGEPAARLDRVTLGPDIDQCCGGALALAYRRLDRGGRLTAPFELWEGGPVFVERHQTPACLYGAGHVGRAIAQALAPLDFALTWVDSRPGVFDGLDLDAEMIVSPLPEAVAEQAPDDAIHLVLTHSHALDLEIVSAVLSREFAFAGLIGSETKHAHFKRRLRERAVPESGIARLTCPIGLPGLRDKRPSAIATSVAAQLLMLEAGR